MLHVNSMINILFTSVGRRVELIQQWQLALKENKIVGGIIVKDIDAPAPALQYVSDEFISPKTKSDKFIRRIITIWKVLKREGISHRNYATMPKFKGTTNG